MNNQQTGSFKLTADQLQADAAHWQSQAAQSQLPDNSLRVRLFNAVLEEAKETPIPQMLFGKFWFEGELCILFSDSNAGKSILATQIGNAISNGSSIDPFGNEVNAQPVLYCDFELTPKQLEARYTENWQQHYRFSDKFFRADMDPDADVPEGFDSMEDYLYFSIESAITAVNARVLMIDNITYISTENETAKFALPLMKQLKALKNQHNLSILVLAHTPKRDASKPITSNDLQGSRMLMNFCDSAFAIGASNEDKDRRYLKQIKQRNTAQVYGGDNVCVFDIIKPGNFLQYAFAGYSNERMHLRDVKEQQNEDMTERALEMKQQGLTLREIGAALGISFQKADRLLKTARQTKAE